MAVEKAAPSLDVLTFEETMRVLKICKPTLRHLIEERKIRYQRVGRQYRFRREWIVAFLEGK